MWPDRTLSGDTLQLFLSPEKGQRKQHHGGMKNDEKQEVRDAFAARIREAMEDAEITGSIRDKAKSLGLPKSTLEGLLNAEKLPGRARSTLIAAKLGVRESWLMTGEEPKRESVTGSPLQISHMTPEDQVAILAVWRSFQSKYSDKEV